MKVETNWLQENYMRVRTEMSRSNENAEQVMDRLAYSEKEKNLLRWVGVN